MPFLVSLYLLTQKGVMGTYNTFLLSLLLPFLILIKTPTYSSPNQALKLSPSALPLEAYKDIQWQTANNNNAFTQSSDFVKGELFLKLQPNSQLAFSGRRHWLQIQNHSLDELVRTYQIHSLQKAFPTTAIASLQDVYVLRFNADEQTHKLLEALNNYDFVAYAERIPLYRSFQMASTNDPDLKAGKLWFLDKVKATEAWEVQKGSSKITVAVIDDAVMTNHEDLAANISAGFDFPDIDEDPSPPRGATVDCFSHGTHCSGLISAVADNQRGIASIGSGVKIMPLKCKKDTDLGVECDGFYHSYNALEYAISNGARVVSMSFGGAGYSELWEELVALAHKKGIVLVAAAGNENTSQAMYPASYKKVISVGATDKDDRKADFSNYGTNIDIMAPGTQIWSTVASSKNAYAYQQGTSMACPIVASVAALMLSYNKRLLPDQILDCLKSTADNIDGKNASYSGQIGAGRLNAGAALRCLDESPDVSFTVDKKAACINENITFNDQSTATASAWKWEFEGGTPATSTSKNPSIMYEETGSFDVRLTITENGATKTKIRRNYIQISAPSATLSGSKTISPGSSATLKIKLAGNPPWSFTYLDENEQEIQIDDIQESPYELVVSPADDHEYTLSHMSDASCEGNYNGTASIRVNHCEDETGEKRGDILLEMFDITCTGEGLLIEIEICNIGSAFLSSKTPISFYSADPTQEKAELLETFQLTRGISIGKCSRKKITLPFQSTPIYMVGNDPGQATSALPFSIEADFPLSTYKECDYTNNIKAIEVNTMASEHIDAGHDETICKGDQIQLNASGAISYLWEPATGLSDPTIANPQANPAQTTTYTVSSVNATGCTSSDQITIFVSPLPYLPPVTLDTTICTGDAALIQLSNIQPIAGYRYRWQPTLGLSNPNIPNPTARLKSSNTYTLTITNAQGCSNTQEFHIDLSINEDNPIDLGEDQIICQGESISFSLPEAERYIWFASDNSLNCLDCQEVIANPTRTSTYYAAIVGAEGCMSSDSITLFVDEPTFNLPNDTSFCQGSKITLEAGDFASYHWSDNSTNSSITLQQGGTYTLLVNTYNGCSFSHRINVHETPLPAVEIIGNTEIRAGETSYLNIESNSNYWTYKWSNGPTMSAIEVEEPATYTLTVTDALGCTFIDSVEVVQIPTKLLIPTAFSPNGDGVNDYFTIPHDPTTQVEFFIYDRWGQCVFESTQQNHKQAQWNGRLHDDGEALKVGVYVYVAILTDENGKQKRVSGNVTLLR